MQRFILVTSDTIKTLHYMANAKEELNMKQKVLNNGERDFIVCNHENGTLSIGTVNRKSNIEAQIMSFDIMKSIGWEKTGVFTTLFLHGTPCTGIGFEVPVSLNCDPIAAIEAVFSK